MSLVGYKHLRFYCHAGLPGCFCAYRRQDHAHRAAEHQHYATLDGWFSGDDPDYAEKYQDEYQGLWHKAAADLQEAKRDLDIQERITIVRVKEREALRAERDRAIERAERLVEVIRYAQQVGASLKWSKWADAEIADAHTATVGQSSTDNERGSASTQVEALSVQPTEKRP